jgi:hypothetical protein
MMWTIGIAIIIIGVVHSMPQGSSGSIDTPTSDQYDVKLIFPADKYPETADHILDAIAKGEPPVCTIDRSESDSHRDASLAGVPTKKGYDRDEWPMAMCAEGGAGADIRYVTPSDNRGAGSWIGGQLDSYADGTRVWIVIDSMETSNEIGSKLDAAARASSGSEIAGAVTKSNAGSDSSSSFTSKKSNVSESTARAEPPVETNVSSAASSTKSKTEVVYKNCNDVRAAGAAPLHKDDPGYSRKLDRDGDGVACE